MKTKNIRRKSINKKRKITWPRITMAYAALNGGKLFERSLDSVRKQSYPKDLIDIVVVDDGSTDDTVKIARKYGARVFIRPKGYIYANFFEAMKKARGEYFFTMETDILLRKKNFIKRMIKPMLSDDRLIATFTKEHPNREMHWTSRFLSYHYAQADPLLEFLFNKLEKTIIEKHRDYMVSEFKDEKLTTEVRMFYRIKYLKKTANWNSGNYFDHDFVINCVRSGFRHFAYVPEPGYYHYHVKSFKHLIQKRIRNVNMHFFPYYKKGDYTILDTSNKKEVFKLMLFIIYANLFFPAAIRGSLRYLKHKDPILFMEPFITIAVTDALLVAFLQNKKGRKFINDSLISFLNLGKKR